MDLVSKYRLIGASVWLFLLVLIVPQWYSHPVNFVPDGKVKVEPKSTLPIIEHAYRLPDSNDEPLTDGQTSHKEQLNNKSFQDNKAPVSEESVLNSKSESDFQNMQEIIKKANNIASSEKYKGQWIVRLLAFEDIKAANDLLGRLEPNFKVYIKYYEKTKMYSVRTGPYLSQAKADKDKEKLDKMLHTNGEVVQLP